MRYTLTLSILPPSPILYLSTAELHVSRYLILLPTVLWKGTAPFSQHLRRQSFLPPPGQITIGHPLIHDYPVRDTCECHLDATCDSSICLVSARDRIPHEIDGPDHRETYLTYPALLQCLQVACQTLNPSGPAAGDIHTDSSLNPCVMYQKGITSSSRLLALSILGARLAFERSSIPHDMVYSLPKSAKTEVES